MSYAYITDKNFGTKSVLKYCINEKYSKRSFEFKYHKKIDSYVFTANYEACPCIYWKRENNMFCFSFFCEPVINYCNEQHIILTYTYDNENEIDSNIRKHIKPSINKRYKYNLNYIEQWSKVILHRDGSFEVTSSKFVTENIKPFSIDIKDNYELFKKFLIKYRNIVLKAIDENSFYPTITGGLDTRALIGLYKNRIKELPGYILSSVKNDGKNNVLQGQLELKLADNVVNIVGLNNHREESLNSLNKKYVTISGMFNENAIEYSNPNDPEYIYKIIQHGYAEENEFLYSNMILPYIDDDYLMFKQDGEVVRVLLIFLLVPELRFAPFISGTSMFNKHPYGETIYPLLNNTIIKVFDIMSYWGIDKIKNILND